jgi:O-antigen ligase
METIHPFASYDFIFRYLNMTLGIFCIAVLSRDRKAIDVALFTFILASALQSVILISGSFHLLKGFTAFGFYDASRARIEAFEELFLKGNLNEISYFSSIGALIGMIWIYYEKKNWKRWILAALTIPSILGVFFPASRTGALIFFASTLIFFFKTKVNLRKWIVPAGLLTLLLIFAIPDVIWVRLSSIMHLSELQESDSRTKVFSAIISQIDQYAFTGVGAGNYWHGWAVSAGITNRFTTDIAMAAHNAFFQLWMYWGLPALLAFFVLMWTFAKAVQRDIAGDRLKTSLYIFVLMIPMIFLFYHSFYHKSFSIGLGMLIGARFWNLFDTAESGEGPVK